MSQDLLKDDLFDAWCGSDLTENGIGILCLHQEIDGARSQAIENIRRLIPRHYFLPQRLRKRLERLGRPKTAAATLRALPKTKRGRSGDLGEILATEYVNRKLPFCVPILRMRWKDGRELALRGDDVLAVWVDGSKRIHFLKGESKSRNNLSQSTIDEALKALRSNRGRPKADTLNFVVHLYEARQDELADILDAYLTTKTIPVRRLTHLLFTLSGNDSTELLGNYFNSYSGKITQIFVGIIVDDHPALVRAAFSEVRLG